MNDPPIPGHLTEGWPDEPGRAEIEAFARDLQGKLPELPSDAMQRIGGQMHDELALARWRKRRLRVIAAVSTLAASLVIGIGVWRMVDAPDHFKQAEADFLAKRADSAFKAPVILDHYRVPVLNAPVAPAPDTISLLPPEERQRIAKQPTSTNDERPLVALESNRSLFVDD